VVSSKKMKIDITNSDYNEVLSLLSQFPNGKVTAKNGAAFWECTGGDSKPQVQQPQIQQQNTKPQINQIPQKQQSSNPFLRAFDSMAERF